MILSQLGTTMNVSAYIKFLKKILVSAISQKNCIILLYFPFSIFKLKLPEVKFCNCANSIGLSKNRRKETLDITKNRNAYKDRLSKTPAKDSIFQQLIYEDCTRYIIVGLTSRCISSEKLKSLICPILGR